MSELAKKNLLAKNLNRMIRALPADFTFVPQTFSLPAELEPLRSWAAAQRRKPTIIVKPDAGCQGRGACRPTRLRTTLYFLYSLEERKPTPQPLTNPNPNPHHRHLHDQIARGLCGLRGHGGAAVLAPPAARRGSQVSIPTLIPTLIVSTVEPQCSYAYS